jgi:hypothetical protein
LYARISDIIERFALIHNGLVVFCRPKGGNSVEQMIVINRLSWRLDQLARASGLSIPFLRKEARFGRLKTRKVGAAVIVLDEDARRFLAGDEAENTNTQSETSLAASV